MLSRPSSLSRNRRSALIRVLAAFLCCTACASLSLAAAAAPIDNVAVASRPPCREGEACITHTNILHATTQGQRFNTMNDRHTQTDEEVNDHAEASSGTNMTISSSTGVDDEGVKINSVPDDPRTSSTSSSSASSSSANLTRILVPVCVVGGLACLLVAFVAWKAYKHRQERQCADKHAQTQMQHSTPAMKKRHRSNDGHVKQELSKIDVASDQRPLSQESEHSVSWPADVEMSTSRNPAMSPRPPGLKPLICENHAPYIKDIRIEVTSERGVTTRLSCA